MRLNMKSVYEKPIKIRRGINIPLVIVTVFAISTFIAVMTSGYWMPDSRPVMDVNNDATLTFNKKSITCSDFYIDEEKQIGEINLMVEMDENADFDDLTFGVQADGYVIYPSESFIVIKGSVLPTNMENKFQQEYLIQFSIPEDFYYISLMVEQNENKTLEYQMDYRNFKSQILSEKGEKYLVGLDDINIKIINQQFVVNETQKLLDGYNNTIKSLEKEVETLNVKIKTITDENALAEQKKNIEDKQASITDYKQKVVDQEEKLANERKVLQEYEQEKALQR